MLKVLIVEDEDIIRRGLAYTIDWLSMGWVAVDPAADGEEGLALIKRRQPDLVLTDIIMPKMSGIEMLEAARRESLPPFKSVILTSYAEFEYARQAVKLDVFDYLLKPIDEEELKKVIERVRAEITAQPSLPPAEGELEKRIFAWNFAADDENIQNAHVTQALHTIRDHYSEKISIEMLAERQRISASYLSRRFREATGQTFLEFLTRYRIQKAVGLLKEGKYRVYEVADLTGFYDYKYFCTVFKKYTQTSPKEFVKSVNCVIQQ